MQYGILNAIRNIPRIETDAAVFVCPIEDSFLFRAFTGTLTLYRAAPKILLYCFVANVTVWLPHKTNTAVSPVVGYVNVLFHCSFGGERTGSVQFLHHHSRD